MTTAQSFTFMLTLLSYLIRENAYVCRLFILYGNNVIAVHLSCGGCRENSLMHYFQLAAVKAGMCELNQIHEYSYVNVHSYVASVVEIILK